MADMSAFLYRCSVFHERRAPRRHAFHFALFLWYFDLDTLADVSKPLKLLSLNRFNWYSFYDSDYLPWPSANASTSSANNRPLKERVRDFLADHGYTLGTGRVMLLTHVRVLGYVFNPISLYFCFDETEKPLCAIAEVSNTFGEVKPYLIPLQYKGNLKNQTDVPSLDNTYFSAQHQKLFYVSPFSRLQQAFQFDFKLPKATLDVRIDTMETSVDDAASASSTKLLISHLTGKREILNNVTLFATLFRYPMMTLQVTASIHWHAFLLFLKKVPFYRKEADPFDQIGILHPHTSISNVNTVLSEFSHPEITPDITTKEAL